MASTARGRRLTEQHRQAQVALRSRFLSEFIPTWSILDWFRIDQTTRPWLRAVTALVRVFRQDSADIAVEYYDRFRAVEAPKATTPPPVIEFSRPRPIGDRSLTSAALLGELERRRSLGRPVSTARPTPEPRPRDRERLVKPRIDWSEFDKAAEKSLLVTGPGELKRRAGRGESEAQAKRGGLVVVSGSATRHVLNGGRGATLKLVEADEKAIGWARVTDNDPCAFCAMLASRGPAYKTQATASFQPHDQCACTAEPVYSRSAAWPGRAREFNRLWYAATKGYSGKDAINAFRRAHDARRSETVLPSVEIA